jgi:signal transduction histidine kinase
MDSSNSNEKEYDEKYLAFVNSLSFDLRGLLTRLKGYSDLLLSEEFDLNDDTKIEYIQQISFITKSANNILEAHKKLAKVESGLLQTKIEPVDLSSIIYDAVEEVKSELESKSVSLQLNLSNNLPMVKARPYEVYEIVRGLLETELTYTVPDAQIIISAVTNKNRVQTTMNISNTNFLEERHKRNYDDFMNLLAIERYIEQFGGEFGEESEEGKGSTIWFTLPIADESVET